MQFFKTLLPVLATITSLGFVETSINPDSFSGGILRRDAVVIGGGSAGVSAPSVQ